MRTRGGEILFCSEEERYSRRKHDTAFPRRALADALRFAGIGIRDVAAVGFYTLDSAHLRKTATHLLRYFPRSLRFLRHVRSFADNNRFEAILRREYGYAGPVHYLKHHLCHAASTFLVSPYEEAAILTLDGTGEWTTTTMGVGRGTRIELFKEIEFPHSLGKLYETFTQYLGFRPNSGEGKVMGLACYGEPAYARQFEEIVRLLPEGEFRLNLDYFEFHTGSRRLYSDRLVRAFGPPRAPESAIEKRHENVAASLQHALERAVEHLLGWLHARTGLQRLCMAGGVSLNSQMNAAMQARTKFGEIFVPPAAGDPGTALGAAKVIEHLILGRERRHELASAYLGPSYSNEEVKRLLSARQVAFEEVADPASRCAEMLAEGKIVGWFQGRAEYGPRALGSRSILADPRREEMKDVLNARVKKREGFRPFAPAVPEHLQNEYFEALGPSPFMLKVWPVREAWKARLPAITHVDGTGRVQTVTRESNPRFYRLIERFGEITGVPVVLNTSFNIRGEPMVHAPEDALACFQGTEMDALFLEDCLVVK
ncbi:MAG: carbamoyltransferase [Candidatus Methylomirabilis sp.]|nr:carbamoyltransferase [Deltaproteobacteria bacterium]